MPSCVVPTCKNASGSVNKQEGITFHRFPKDEVRKSKWTIIIRQTRLEELWKPSKASVICSIHFDAECFIDTEAGLRLLKKEAIPNKHLALALENSKSGRLTPKSDASLPHQSPSSSCVHDEIADVDIADLESVFDTPLMIKLKSQLRRREIVCHRHKLRLKTLQKKAIRLAKRNDSLKNMLKNLINRRSVNGDVILKI